MDAIGKRLRETRERLGLSLNEAERATRIRIYHLEAIERGDLDALPSPVQARGFLRNYAEFLGLDAETVLLDYAERLQSQLSRRQAEVKSSQEQRTRPSVQVRSKRPRWLSSDLFFAAGITIGIVAVLIWGVGRVMASLRTDAQPTELSEFLSSPAVSSPDPAAAAAAVETQRVPTSTPLLEGVDEPTATAPPLFLGSTSTVSVQLVIEKRAWLRVLLDGVEVFQGRVKAGETLDFQAEERVEVQTGNGAGVRVLFNGQDGGLLGDLGQVVVRIWTFQGPITPTPTQTFTATPLPSQTITVTQGAVQTETAPGTP